MIEKGFTYLWSKLPTKWRVDLIILALGISLGIGYNMISWRWKEFNGKVEKAYRWYLKDSLKEKSPTVK